MEKYGIRTYTRIHIHTYTHAALLVHMMLFIFYNSPFICSQRYCLPWSAPQQDLKKKKAHAQPSFPMNSSSVKFPPSLLSVLWHFSSPIWSKGHSHLPPHPHCLGLSISFPQAPIPTHLLKSGSLPSWIKPPSRHQKAASQSQRDKGQDQGCQNDKCRGWHLGKASCRAEIS